METEKGCTISNSNSFSKINYHTCYASSTPYPSFSFNSIYMNCPEMSIKNKNIFFWIIKKDAYVVWQTLFSPPKNQILWTPLKVQMIDYNKYNTILTLNFYLIVEPYFDKGPLFFKYKTNLYRAKPDFLNMPSWAHYIPETGWCQIDVCRAFIRIWLSKTSSIK